MDVEAALQRVKDRVDGLTPKYVLQLLIVGFAYFLAAKFGLSLAGATKQVTSIWPPAAIALSALFLGGYRFWPGVWLGAFVANFSTDTPFLVAMVIASGNTLAGVTGVYLLRRVVGLKGTLTTVNGALGFIAVAFLSTLVSATIGTFALSVSNLSSAYYSSIWFIWWLGDTMGILIFAPFLLLVLQPRLLRPLRNRIPRISIFLTTLSLFAFAVFMGRGNFAFASYLSPYMMFPFIIWAVLWFKQIGSTGTTFIIAVLAISGVVVGGSPFINTIRTTDQNLIILCLYLTTLAMTSILLGAIEAERSSNREVLQQRNKALVVAKAQAEKNAARLREVQLQQSRLVNMASHELRTPLTSAQLFASILQKETSGGSAHIKEYVQKISAELERLGKLTRDLIEVSRSRSGRLHLEKEIFNLDELLNDEVKILQQTLAHRHALTKQNKNDVRIVADKDRIRQVLDNLISNAVNYSPAGTNIIVSTSVGKRFVTVRVQDFGPGISQVRQKKLFEPFYRIKNRKNRNPSGLGLGLFITRQIIELHGGKIWVESKSGKGSTFGFDLPLRTRS